MTSIDGTVSLFVCAAARARLPSLSRSSVARIQYRVLRISGFRVTTSARLTVRVVRYAKRYGLATVARWLGGSGVVPVDNASRWSIGRKTKVDGGAPLGWTLVRQRVFIKLTYETVAKRDDVTCSQGSAKRNRVNVSG